MLTGIVCATDLSRRSDRALERAAQLAEQHGVPFHVVHVIDPDLPASLWQSHPDQVKMEIRGALDRISAAAPPAVIETLVGRPASEIALYARGRRGCLVVLGCPRLSAEDASFGSFSAGRILRAAVAPVLVVKGPGPTRYRRAVVGIDLTLAAKRAALLACELVREGEIFAVNAFDPPGKDAHQIRENHQRALGKFLDTFYIEREAAKIDSRVSVTAVVTEDDPKRALMAEVARTGAELLVLGTHGRTGLSRALFGSVADKLLMAMPCDLLIAVPND